MRFSTASAFAALCALAAANTVEFINQDSTTRTIVFTANEGLEAIPSLKITGLATGTATFPADWQGNFFSVSEGSAATPGMLGEVMFGGYAGATYFDVSAIVDPNDIHGVKEIYPKESKTPLSGCQSFPCANAYNQPDDIQTLSTTETDLVCLIGTKTNNVRRHPRDFVTGARV